MSEPSNAQVAVTTDERPSGIVVTVVGVVDASTLPDVTAVLIEAEELPPA